MEAEQVVEKILSQGRDEAEKLLAEARSKAEAENRRLEQELSDFDAESRKLAERAAEDKTSRMTAAERIAQAKELLATKNKLLDELFDRVRGKIENLDHGQYTELMYRLLKDAAGTGEKEVIIGKNESRIGPELIERVNGELGGRAHLKLSEKRADIGGGFILSWGNVRVNAGADVLVGQLRERSEMELAGRLFGG